MQEINSPDEKMLEAAAMDDLAAAEVSISHLLK